MTEPNFMKKMSILIDLMRVEKSELIKALLEYDQYGQLSPKTREKLLEMIEDDVMQNNGQKRANCICKCRKR